MSLRRHVSLKTKMNTLKTSTQMDKNFCQICICNTSVKDWGGGGMIKSVPHKLIRNLNKCLYKF